MTISELLDAYLEDAERLNLGIGQFTLPPAAFEEFLAEVEKRPDLVEDRKAEGILYRGIPVYEEVRKCPTYSLPGSQMVSLSP